MHSRIIQVSKTPIATENYISSCNYDEHWFTNSIADYVSDDCDRSEDIKWLASNNFGIDIVDDNMVIVLKSKEIFFAKAFGTFTGAAEKASKMTLDEFCSGCNSGIIFTLKDAYEEKFGFYIDENDELISLDNWVRIADTDTPYFVGGTVDYHW